jgi:hypothetical protein
MHGLNKLFMKNPYEFLRTRPVLVEERSATNARGTLYGTEREDKVPPSGIYAFDLRPGERGAVILDRMEWRGVHTGRFSRVITAYWLPWISENTALLQLSTDAPFFFTSNLDGCRVQIGTGASPLVAHIAADGGPTGGKGEKGRQWREAQAEKHLGEGRSRAYSSADYGDSAFFCGFYSGSQWCFLAQTIDFKGGVYSVRELQHLTNH